MSGYVHCPSLLPCLLPQLAPGAPAVPAQDSTALLLQGFLCLVHSWLLKSSTGIPPKTHLICLLLMSVIASVL